MAHHSEFLKTRNKILKAAKERKAHYVQRNKNMDDSRFIIRNNEGSGTTSVSTEKEKKPIKPDLYTQ